MPESENFPGATRRLTVGATDGLFIGMINRTELGHSGQLLQSGVLETSCYVLLQCTVILRVLPLLGLGELCVVHSWQL